MIGGANLAGVTAAGALSKPATMDESSCSAMINCVLNDRLPLSEEVLLDGTALPDVAAR